MACSPNCKKASVFTIGTVLLLGGVLAGLFWSNVTDYIYQTELSLSPSSKGYEFWKETPIPMYLDFYFFNWTNPEQTKKGAKPRFKEIGPYTFSEKHTRVNITWHPENDTVTFQQIRNWDFIPSKSVGTLDDKITSINVIAATIASKMKNSNPIIKKIASAILDTVEGAVSTHTVKEFLFDGFHDRLLDIAKKIEKATNITLPIPFEKFGWFYGRNMSSTYDGIFNMYTGRKNMSSLGALHSWNNLTHTPYYEGKCGDVVGTTGELLPPLKYQNYLDIFASDLCSTLTLTRSDTMVDKHGIQGPRFFGDAREFDNGTLYPEYQCFSPKDNIMASGVRDMSKCRYGSPAYVSFPHFYLADPDYVKNVTGLHPKKEDHEFYLDVEENTGLPLEVRAQLQINIFIERIKGIGMFGKMQTVMFPAFYFKQYVSLTPELASQVKLLINLSNIGTITFYGIASLGGFLLFLGIIITIRSGWGDSEESQLLINTASRREKLEESLDAGE